MEPKVKSYFEVIEKIDTAEDYSDAQKRAQLSLSELMTKHQKSLITLGLV